MCVWTTQRHTLRVRARRCVLVVRVCGTERKIEEEAMTFRKEMLIKLNVELGELRQQVNKRGDLQVLPTPNAFDNRLLMAARETAVDLLVQKSAKLREV